MPSNPTQSTPWMLVVASMLEACGLVTGSPGSVVHPQFEDGGMVAEATPLDTKSADLLEGIWDSTEGNSLLGSSLVLRRSPGYLSLFGNRDATYAVLEAGCLADGRLVSEGYYRTAIDDSTGLVRMFLQPPEASLVLCSGEAYAGPLEWTGSYGEGNGAPDQGLSIELRRALPAKPTSMVIAHRGGCRTSDDCGASENSLEILRMAQRLGADRIEVDVQVTSDGVPVLYHDESFGPSLTRGRYCRGKVSDFTWAHVTQLCTLQYGEAVPRLNEALRVAVEETELVGLWLDVKTVTGMNAALPLVRQWDRVATERGRNLRIVVGLSTAELVSAWLQLDQADRTDCLVETSVDDLRNTGCRVWAPRWTLGPMAATVAQLQSEGYSVAFWTLDEEQFIDLFLSRAQPNGILTNRPGLVLQRSYMDAISREQAP
jgi:glycerophosphoryl diester phosphodiesterase